MVLSGWLWHSVVGCGTQWLVVALSGWLCHFVVGCGTQCKAEITIVEMNIQNIAYYQDPQLDNSTFLLYFSYPVIINPLILQNTF